MLTSFDILPLLPRKPSPSTFISIHLHKHTVRYNNYFVNNNTDSDILQWHIRCQLVNEYNWVETETWNFQRFCFWTSQSFLNRFSNITSVVANL